MIRSSSSGMAWENTLLASRILPPAYMPVDVATNRSQDASLMLEQGAATHEIFLFVFVCHRQFFHVVEGRRIDLVATLENECPLCLLYLRLFLLITFFLVRSFELGRRRIDGRLTLLVILTTSAGLAIVLLFFILLR